MKSNNVITPELKQQVYDYHIDLHTNDNGIGGSIHKRVRERFNLTSDEVVDIVREMESKAEHPQPLKEDTPNTGTVTSGEWSYKHSELLGVGSIHDANGKAIFMAMGINGIEDEKEAEANANRIVQAVNGWDALKLHHAENAVKLTAYQVKCERLQADNEQLQKGTKYAEKVGYETSKTNANLMADNERLREAIKLVMPILENPENASQYLFRVDILKAALQNK